MTRWPRPREWVCFSWCELRPRHIMSCRVVWLLQPPPAFKRYIITCMQAKRNEALILILMLMLILILILTLNLIDEAKQKCKSPSPSQCSPPACGEIARSSNESQEKTNKQANLKYIRYRYPPPETSKARSGFLPTPEALKLESSNKITTDE